MLNQILVNYAQRGQRARKESDYRQSLKVRVTGCEARAKLVATIRQIACISDIMSRFLGNRLMRLWVGLFQQSVLAVLFCAAFVFVYHVAG